MILATFENKEIGIAATVAKNDRGYYVSIKDTDVGEYIPFGIIYPDLNRAIAEAQKAVLA